MDPVAMLLTAVGLAMDCLAVSTSCGLTNPRAGRKDSLVLAGAFGGFQGGMAFLGWLGGITLADYIEPVDHWLAFALLLLIGLRMVYEAFRGGGDCRLLDITLPRTVLLLAVATSIDALAVGISYAFLHSRILVPALVIGFMSFVLAMTGLAGGRWIRRRGSDDMRWSSLLGSRAELAGGIILVLLGVKILAEHVLL